MAAGLPEKNDSKPRKKATEIYEGSHSGSQNDEDDMTDQHRREDSTSMSIGQQSLPSVLPPTLSANGDIPVHQLNQQSQPGPKLPPLMPTQMGAGNQRTTQKAASTYNRQLHQTAAGNAKLNNKSAPKKRQIPSSYTAPKPAFDVETSIFDPNNNFGVTSAKAYGLHRPVTGHKSGYDVDDLSSDSSISSDDDIDNLFYNTAAGGNIPTNDASLANRAILNSAMMKISNMPSLSTPQVSETFLSKVVYDNAAIEHAAQNPTNYDRLPWSMPANKTYTAVNGQLEDLTHDDTLASLESRLQSISASLKATDAAVAQHAG